MASTLIIFPTPLDATCELRTDAGAVIAGVFATHPTGRPGQGFPIPEGAPNRIGALLTMTAQGKAPLRQRGILFLNDGSFPYPWTPGQTAAFAADDFTLSPASSASLPLEAIHLQGRQGFHTAAGAHVPLTGVTGFKLVHLVATGQQAAARAFLESIQPARTVRVLTMAKHLFELPPAVGMLALPETLALAAEYGKYLSVVSLADTKSYQMDLETHVRAIGLACAGSPACAFDEIGNELSPLHSTQDHRLGDLAFLKHLRTLIPSSVPVSLGSTHADQDESDIFKDGDLLTVHSDRSDGDEGWRWVRHTNELRGQADRLGKHVVNDEPRRDDLSTDKHLALALLCRMFRISDTFHCKAGLQCEPLSGAELVAFQARARGWAAIPDDWIGQYANTGFSHSPVKSFNGAVRIYSSVNGGQAYSLVLGAQAGLRIDWDDKWERRDRVISEGGAQLWRVSR